MGRFFDFLLSLFLLTNLIAGIQKQVLANLLQLKMRDTVCKLCMKKSFMDISDGRMVFLGQFYFFTSQKHAKCSVCLTYKTSTRIESSSSFPGLSFCVLRKIQNSEYLGGASKLVKCWAIGIIESRRALIGLNEIWMRLGCAGQHLPCACARRDDAAYDR